MSNFTIYTDIPLELPKDDQVHLLQDFNDVLSPKRDDGKRFSSTSENLKNSSPVSQRIWTPRGFGPPGPNPLADLDSPGPYPLADLDPLRGFGPPTKHSFFPIYSNGKLLGDVL